ncbi:hypothetical protein [Mesorhizobium sp.]|uniref:hypothetical protein n=1 Tax=Mesorhizobium sp. TaxID=1871066 RepID=UPI00257D3A6E|nr:hypothetical protein [Mesorhizobium sp.]
MEHPHCVSPLPEQKINSNIGAIGDNLFFDPREEEMRAIAFFCRRDSGYALNGGATGILHCLFS